jgi:hypothetical protein
LQKLDVYGNKLWNNGNGMLVQTLSDNLIVPYTMTVDDSDNAIILVSYARTSYLPGLGRFREEDDTGGSYQCHRILTILTS